MFLFVLCLLVTDVSKESVNKLTPRDNGQPSQRIRSFKSPGLDKPPIGRPKLSRTTSDSVRKELTHSMEKKISPHSISEMKSSYENEKLNTKDFNNIETESSLCKSLTKVNSKPESSEMNLHNVIISTDKIFNKNNVECSPGINNKSSSGVECPSNMSDNHFDIGRSNSLSSSTLRNLDDKINNRIEMNKTNRGISKLPKLLAKVEEPSNKSSEDILFKKQLPNKGFETDNLNGLLNSENNNINKIKNSGTEYSNNSLDRRNSLERPSYFNSLYNANRSSLPRLSRNRTTSLLEDDVSLRKNYGAEDYWKRKVSDGHLNNTNLGYETSTTAFMNRRGSQSKINSYVTSCQIENKDPLSSEYDVPPARQYSTLGRSLSYRGPRPNYERNYETLRPSRNYGSFSKDSSIYDTEKYKQRSPSRFSTSNYKELTAESIMSKCGRSKIKSENGEPIKSEVPIEQKTQINIEEAEKNVAAMSKIPSFQRSTSLNSHAEKSTTVRRSLSVTPDRSILGKFLSENKSDSNISERKSIVIKDVVNEGKKKERRVSRFLRPDFYDTPKEESLYAKQKESKAEGKVDYEKQNIKLKKKKEKDGKNMEEEKYAKEDLNEKQELNGRKKENLKQEKNLGIIEKAIRSLREKSISKDSECMSLESNLIKRAVSLEDCSIVKNNKLKRSASVTPQSSVEKKERIFQNLFTKKKSDDVKIKDERKLNQKKKTESINKSTESKDESVVKKIMRKVSPKINSLIRRKSSESGYTISGNCSSSFLLSTESGISTNEDSGAYSVQHCHSLESKSRIDSCDIKNRIDSLDIKSRIDSLDSKSRIDGLDSKSRIDGLDSKSRISRIAALKNLEFFMPVPSTDSTPSYDDDRSKLSFEMDDSSSFLSPTEDSDTWSASSDYADARDFAALNAEDSVSERIRRKSFYSRFNQTKRRKPPQLQSNQSSARSRLPLYTKSYSSDFSKLTSSSLRKSAYDK